MSSVAVPSAILVNSESAQFWQHCAAGEHALFCSSESFVTQLRQRLLTRLGSRDVTYRTSASMHLLRKSRSCPNNALYI